MKYQIIGDCHDKFYLVQNTKSAIERYESYWSFYPFLRDINIREYEEYKAKSIFSLKQARNNLKYMKQKEGFKDVKLKIEII